MPDLWLLQPGLSGSRHHYVLKKDGSLCLQSEPIFIKRKRLIGMESSDTATLSSGIE